MPSWLTSTASLSLARSLVAGRVLHAAKMPGTIEQAELIGDFANAEAQLLRVRDVAAGGDREPEMIKLGLAVSIGPPQARILHGELRELCRRELHGVVARRRASLPCSPSRLRSWPISVAFDWCVRCVRQRHVDFDACARVVSGSGRVVTTCGSPIFTVFVAVIVTGCQMPVSRSRIAGIQSHPSVATNVGPSRHMMPPFSPGPPLIDCSCGMPGCGGGETRTASTFVCPGFQNAGHVEVAANERAGDRAQRLPIEPHRRAVVDAVEGQREALAAEVGGRFEFRPVPVVLLVQGLRNRQIVEAVVGIGINAAIDQRRQHRARHRRRHTSSSR